MNDPNNNPSQADKILKRLQETPNEWVPMPELAQISGAYAVHSRITNLRKRKLTIPNRQEPDLRGGSRKRLSYYKLITPQPAA